MRIDASSPPQSCLPITKDQRGHVSVQDDIPIGYARSTCREASTWARNSANSSSDSNRPGRPCRTPTPPAEHPCDAPARRETRRAPGTRRALRCSRSLPPPRSSHRTSPRPCTACAAPAASLRFDRLRSYGHSHSRRKHAVSVSPRVSLGALGTDQPLSLLIFSASLGSTKLAHKKIKLERLIDVLSKLA